MAILKSAFLFCLVPKDFVIAVRVKRRVDIDRIDTFLREFPKLIEIVSPINNARVY